MQVSLLGKACLLAFIMLPQHSGSVSSQRSPIRIKVPDKPAGPDLPVAVSRETRAPLNAAKLNEQADQLAKLAQSIPPDIDKATKGQLAQDLPARLKKIEKLSKQLRRGILP